MRSSPSTTEFAYVSLGWQIYQGYPSQEVVGINQPYHVYSRASNKTSLLASLSATETKLSSAVLRAAEKAASFLSWSLRSNRNLKCRACTGRAVDRDWREALRGLGSWLGNFCKAIEDPCSVYGRWMTEMGADKKEEMREKNCFLELDCKMSTRSWLMVTPSSCMKI